MSSEFVVVEAVEKNLNPLAKVVVRYQEMFGFTKESHHKATSQTTRIMKLRLHSLEASFML